MWAYPIERVRPTVLQLLLLVGWVSAGAVWAYASPSDVRFIDGLRERRLYRLADSFCQQQLRDPQISLSRRGQLTIQSIRLLAEFAVDSAPAERPPLWRRAREAASDFVRQFPDYGRRPLVEYQDVMTLLARGELARQEAEMGANAESAWAVAKDDFRAAIRQLGVLQKHVTRLKSRAVANSTEDSLSSGELEALSWNIQRQTARAYRNQALCYPAGSDDRVASLAGAVSLLENAIRAMASDHPLIWDMRLELAMCQRMLQDFTAARRSLTGIDQNEVPIDMRFGRAG